MNKQKKLIRLKSLLRNDLDGLVFFAERPLINEEKARDDDLYYCIVNGHKIYKKYRELKHTKAVVWNEIKSY